MVTLSARVILKFRKQFLTVLRNIHFAGVCHGDLKKDNLCYMDGTASIIDFSRANRVSKGEVFGNGVHQLDGILTGHDR